MTAAVTFFASFVGSFCGSFLFHMARMAVLRVQVARQLRATARAPFYRSDRCWVAALDVNGLAVYCARGRHDDDEHRADNVPSGAKWSADFDELGPVPPESDCG